MQGFRRADVAWSAGIAAATVALGAAVALHRVEFGSTAGRWVFRYLGALEPRVVAFALAAGVAVAVAHPGARRLGLDAMGLWLLVPSKIAFHPVPNVVSPLPAVLAVWCMARYLDSQRLPWAAAAGVAAYATTLFDPLALWIGVAFTPLLAD